jgi:hypothetical protein
MLINDASCCCWVYILKAKSNTFEAFQGFKVLVKKQYKGVICFLCQDKGGKFFSHCWDQFLTKQGICQENTTTATPEQNSVAEQKNCVLAELVVALLNEAKLPKSFWAEALNSVYTGYHRI